MKKKLTILWLSSWFPSKVNLYAGDFVERHAQAVSSIHNVVVIFVKGSYGNKEVVREEKVRGQLRIINLYYPKTSFKLRNHIYIFRLYLKEIYKLQNIDLIHANVLFPIGILVWLLNRVKGWEYVFTEHWTVFLEENKAQLSRIKKWIIKQIIKKCSYLLPVSHNLAVAISKVQLYSNCYVIPNVVDTDIFKPNFSTERNTVSIKFLHISSLAYQKNIEGMLRVIKKLTEDNYIFEFYIGGNGDLGFITNFILKNNLAKVVYTFGPLTHKEVAEKMQFFDCFVLFSHFENQPCVINEAFACGLPVIAGKVGGISEFFPEDFGLLVERGNEDELYIAMKSIIENRAKFASKEIMYTYAQNTFGVEAIAGEFNYIYQKVLKN